MADSLIKPLPVKALQVPVFVKKEFNIQCCIRGYDIFQTQRNAEIGARLITAPETSLGALAEDKYAVAVKNYWRCSKVLNELDILVSKK